MWTSSVLRPKKYGGSFGFQCLVANMVGGDAAVIVCVKCENPWALPPFPTWEGVLATETSDLGIIDGWCDVSVNG